MEWNPSQEEGNFSWSERQSEGPGGSGGQGVRAALGPAVWGWGRPLGSTLISGPGTTFCFSLPFSQCIPSWPLVSYQGAWLVFLLTFMRPLDWYGRRA